MTKITEILDIRLKYLIFSLNYKQYRNDNKQ